MNMNAIQRIRNPESPLNFRAWDEHVYDAGNRQIEGYKSIYRKIDERPVHLGIVSSRYHLTQNWEMFSAAERALEAIFGTDLKVEIKDQETDEGGTSLRQYLVHGTERPVRGPGGTSPSTLAFRVIVSNTFDGSSARKITSGAIDFFCTNGMILGEFDKFVSTHNGEFRIDRMVNFIKVSHIQFGKEADRASALLETPVSFQDGFDLLLKLNDTDLFRKHIQNVWDENCTIHGINLWAMTSAATYWASTEHDGWANPTSAASRNKAPVRRINRQHEVRRWMAEHVVPRVNNKIIEHV